MTSWIGVNWNVSTAAVVCGATDCIANVAICTKLRPETDGYVDDCGAKMYTVRALLLTGAIGNSFALLADDCVQVFHI